MPHEWHVFTTLVTTEYDHHFMNSLISCEMSGDPLRFTQRSSKVRLIMSNSEFQK